MAIALVPTETNLFRIVQAIRQIIQGRLDAVLDVTLAANAATTVVPWINCSTTSRVFLFPQTAHAAAAVATTFVLRANILQGSFTISHANDAQTDKTFSALVVGG